MNQSLRMLFLAIFFGVFAGAPDYFEPLVRALGYTWVLLCLLDAFAWCIEKIRDKGGERVSR